ncbi:MAG: homoserine O-acetyltransferase [Armatimonadota bacterium]
MPLQDAPDAPPMIVTKETFRLTGGITLESGVTLPVVDVAFERYGELSTDGRNVVLIAHGITGSSHAAGKYAVSNRSSGYWDDLIGPGKAIDTNRWCVIAPNFLGGCRGTTGSLSTNPSTGRPYGPDFPQITIRDMIATQKVFLEQCFGVTELACVAGGSMGGFQALEWAAMYPDAVRGIIPVATALTPNPRAIAYNHCARTAIRLDPAFHDGHYLEHGVDPDAGLALARMIGTISYLSDSSFQDMFHDGCDPLFSRDISPRSDFLVEDYLNDEGDKLNKRFDANTYILIARALDSHGLARGRTSLDDVFRTITARILAIGFSSDDLFPSRQTIEIAERAHRGGNENAEAVILDSDYGHDAFLVHQRMMIPVINRFMACL